METKGTGAGLKGKSYYAPMTKIKLPATIENLEILVAFVSKCAGEQGFNGTRIKEIELATEEVLVNIVNYAYPERSGDVEVSCRREDVTGFVIEISDNGIPFDPLSLPEPDLSPDILDRKVGGLGVFFIRKMMDEVLYRREEGSNIIRLTVNCMNNCKRSQVQG